MALVFRVKLGFVGMYVAERPLLHTSYRQAAAANKGKATQKVINTGTKRLCRNHRSANKNIFRHGA